MSRFRVALVVTACLAWTLSGAALAATRTAKTVARKGNAKAAPRLATQGTARLSRSTKAARSTRSTKKRSTARASRTSRQHARSRRARRAPVVAVRGSRGSIDTRVQVRRGDTLEGVLESHGVGGAAARQWIDAAADVYDLTRIRPRRGLTLRFDRASRELEAIRYEIDDRSMLVVEDTSEGLQARQEGLPYYVEVRGLAGRIDHSLRDDALRAGVPERIVSDVAEIFGWDTDVEEGLLAGDEFRVLYESIWRAGLAYPEVGKLLAAQIVRDGDKAMAIYFEDDDGRGGYYRPTGEAVSRTFIRYPIEFVEITSGFSRSRRHPILHVSRPHKGVDFAAPYGTPVRAASGGRVIQAGRGLSGLGISLRVEHLNGIITTYGHLSEIADGVSDGRVVDREQVIGYVGATGLATGPHLHYEIEKDGVAVDPLQMMAAEGPVPDGLRRTFDKVKQTVVAGLASLPADEMQRTLAFSSTAGPSPAYDEE